MDQPEEPILAGAEEPQPEAPTGASSYGWLWIVGIILVVAGALWALQKNVPAPTPSETDVKTPATITEEIPLQTPGIYNVRAPKSAASENIVGIDWVVSALNAGTVGHTAVHWGTVSLANETFDAARGPDKTYPNMTTEYLNGVFAIPGKFETNLVLPKSGTVYYRVHAVIDGKNYWSPEESISIENK